MTHINLQAAWIGILLGAVLGGLQGLFFHRDGWLGGYGSWPRRMLRLGHISFFGLALINLALSLTATSLGLDSGLWWPSRLFLLGAIAMPTICYLSAFHKPFRHLFPIPVLSVIVGTALFLARMRVP